MQEENTQTEITTTTGAEDTTGTDGVENTSTETAQTETTTTQTPEQRRNDSVPISRFNEVYAEKKALQRALEALGTKQVAEQPKAEVKDEAPDPKNYEGRETQYYADVAAHAARQEFQRQEASRLQREQAAQQQQSAATASMNYHTQISQEIAKDPNLQYQLEYLKTVQFSTPTALLIEGHPQAGILAKHLANNLQEAHELAALSQTNPMAAAMRIGEIASSYKGNGQPTKLAKTKAPDPITPVNGGGKTNADYVPGESSTADFVRRFYPPPQ